VTALAFSSDLDSGPARRVSQLNGLYALQDDDVPAVVWDRDIPDDFQAWINGIAPENLPSTRVRLKTKDVRAAAHDICAQAGMPECAERDWMVKDVAALADIFASIMTTWQVALRFDVLTGNACRKFHIDVVSSRLICTYRGPGTQYGVPKSGNDPDQIFDVPTGSPIMLRGTRWPNQSGPDVRHRSPPIEGSGTTRLNLVLDDVQSDGD